MRRAIVSLIVALCACSSQQAESPGGDAAAAGDAGPTACASLPSASAACAACETRSCCDQATVCASDKACAAFETCLAACAGDAACRSACVADGGASIPTRWPALATCQATECADACGSGCGKGWVFPAGACGQCIEQHCCSEAADCATDVACTGLDACERGCAGDPTCSTDCRLTYSGGVPRYDALATCESAGDCAAACTGADLSCVGKVEWPTQASTEYGVQLVLTDAQSNKLLPGVQAFACARDAVECTPQTALASAVTDQSGLAGFVLHGKDLGWLRVEGPGVGPFLSFFRPPLGWLQYLGAFVSSEDAFIQQMAPAGVIDPTKAQLKVTVDDCQNRTMAGATVEIVVLGAEQPVVYVRADRTPDPSLDQTGPTGEAHAINIPITEADGWPLADITVRRKSDGLKLAHTSVRVRAGYASVLWWLPPTPATE